MRSAIRCLWCRVVFGDAHAYLDHACAKRKS